MEKLTCDICKRTLDRKKVHKYLIPRHVETGVYSYVTFTDAETEEIQYEGFNRNFIHKCIEAQEACLCNECAEKIAGMTNTIVNS